MTLVEAIRTAHRRTARMGGLVYVVRNIMSSLPDDYRVVHQDPGKMVDRLQNLHDADYAFCFGRLLKSRNDRRVMDALGGMPQRISGSILR